MEWEASAFSLHCHCETKRSRTHYTVRNPTFNHYDLVSSITIRRNIRGRCRRRISDRSLKGCVTISKSAYSSDKLHGSIMHFIKKLLRAHFIKTKYCWYTQVIVSQPYSLHKIDDELMFYNKFKWVQTAVSDLRIWKCGSENKLSSLSQEKNEDSGWTIKLCYGKFCLSNQRQITSVAYTFGEKASPGVAWMPWVKRSGF